MGQPFRLGIGADESDQVGSPTGRRRRAHPTCHQDGARPRLPIRGDAAATRTQHGRGGAAAGVQPALGTDATVRARRRHRGDRRRARRPPAGHAARHRRDRQDSAGRRSGAIGDQPISRRRVVRRPDPVAQSSRHRVGDRRRGPAGRRRRPSRRAAARGPTRRPRRARRARQRRTRRRGDGRPRRRAPRVHGRAPPPRHQPCPPQRGGRTTLPRSTRSRSTPRSMCRPPCGC